MKRVFMDNARNYLLVTACKNEAENLPSLIELVIGQTVRPVAWVNLHSILVLTKGQLIVLVRR